MRRRREDTETGDSVNPLQWFGQEVVVTQRTVVIVEKGGGGGSERCSED